MNKQNSLSQMVNDPSCMEDYDPNAMSVSHARTYIKQFLNPITETENLALMQSLGRVLAVDIISPSNVPNHNNSAMDGFAFKVEDVAKPLKMIGIAFAGQPFIGEIKSGECVKIMTGAVLPLGANTVVMQEKTSKQGDFVHLV